MYHVEHNSGTGWQRCTFNPVDEASARKIEVKLYNTDGVLSVRRVPVDGRFVA